MILPSRFSGALRKAKERKEVYLPRECCEVIRPPSMKPPEGAGMGELEGNSKTRKKEKKEMHKKRDIYK